MELKKTSPISSSFFYKTDASNPDTSKKDQQQEQRKKEKNPTKEQVLEAVELLNSDFDFLNQGLKAEFLFDRDRYGILIRKGDAGLRKVFGHEVFTILANSFHLKENQPVVGRILDRKV